MPEQIRSRDCQVGVSTIFQFDSPTFQNGANFVYEYKKQFDQRQSSLGKQTVYQFKSDFERMQYLIGLYGRTSEGRR